MQRLRSSPAAGARARALAVLLVAALLLPPPALAGKIKFGGSSSSFSKPASSSSSMFGGSSKPAMGTPAPTVMGTPALGGAGGGSFKPAPGAALPTMPVRAAGAPGGGMGGMGGFSGPKFGSGAGASSWGQRSSSIMPFAMGAFAGTAAYALLSSNPSARCNGFKPECYRSLCVKAQEGCPDTKGKQLAAVPCPSGPWTECWGTNDTSFQCLGHPRPSSSKNLDAYCLAPLSNGTAPAGYELVSTSRNGAGAARGGALAAALLAGAALLLV
ncbi:hypothetical protein Rsub_12510 [Raphidocelis subcapitata]|uniref:Uncharacterized protein n=1 Tax=Raphidocelis subcapitata TaxID=307507 RepID=A0A2V0PPB1_9CHLO|nr:hypothetical protein Rsub_12510 [Raphidocelis subcapitata]|eukprot:GBF99870.1 hypothetical protein Rsub_12510 [Raphidocelis subcapitata]